MAVPVMSEGTEPAKSFPAERNGARAPRSPKRASRPSSIRTVPKRPASPSSNQGATDGMRHRASTWVSSCASTVV